MSVGKKEQKMNNRARLWLYFRAVNLKVSPKLRKGHTSQQYTRLIPAKAPY
jgi:hypothetical protein